MLKYFLLIIFLPYIAVAQNASADSSANKSCFLDPMPVILKTAPIAPFYKNKMATLGIEVPIYKSVSAGLEAGYIFGSSEKLEELNTSKLNFDLRLDAKYYFVKASTLRLYTGPVIQYKQVNTDRGVIRWYVDKDENGREVDMMYVDRTATTAMKRETVNILWQAGLQPVLCSRITFNLFSALGVGMDFDRSTTKEGETSRNQTTYLGSLTGVHVGYAF